MSSTTILIPEIADSFDGKAVSRCYSESYFEDLSTISQLPFISIYIPVIAAIICDSMYVRVCNMFIVSGGKPCVAYFYRELGICLMNE